MREDAGLSYLAGGWLATFNYLGYMSGALLAATIQRLQVKYTLYRIGLIAAVLSTAAMGLTTNVMLWALLRFIGGVTAVCGMLIASGLIMNWLIRQRQRPLLGIHFAGLGLGIVVSGLAVGFMVDRLSWDQQWLWLGALGVVFFIPAWVWMPPPADVTHHAAQAAPALPSNRWMKVLIAAYFCAGFGYVISATFIVAIVEGLPALTGKGSWVWVMLGIAAAPSTFLWDRIAQHMGQIPALLLAYAIQVVSFVLPLLSSSALPNVISAILYGTTFVGIVSLTLSLVGRYSPNNPAKAMARLTLSYGAAQVIAPAIAGYIAEATGSYQGALRVAALAMGVGIVLLTRLKN